MAAPDAVSAARAMKTPLAKPLQTARRPVRKAMNTLPPAPRQTRLLTSKPPATTQKPATTVKAAKSAAVTVMAVTVAAVATAHPEVTAAPAMRRCRMVKPLLCKWSSMQE